MSRRTIRPAGPARRTQVRRPGLERLEARELMAGFTVTTAADNGSNAGPTPGSLRAAIVAADGDTSSGQYAITFDIPGGGVQTIRPPSALPAITRTFKLDGTTQPGYSISGPAVAIDGSTTGAGANGLTVTGGFGNVIQGLSIVGFRDNNGQGGAAIYLQGPSGQSTVEGNYIGVRADGQTAQGNASGIVVTSASNTIGGPSPQSRNLIDASTNAGVLIVGPVATGNLVQGNLIGTNNADSATLGNQFGVVLAASGNTVGGTSAGTGNVISGNVGPTGQTGIGIQFEGVSKGNLVQGNQVGTNSAGNAAILVPGDGFSNTYGIYFGSTGDTTNDNISLDTIGGTGASAGNLISGNFIGITGNVTGSLIAGNTIGLAADGAAAIPNGDGILLGATLSTIGGSTAAARNIISGSTTVTGLAGTGLDLTGDSDVVSGNYVGLTAAGLASPTSGNQVGMALHVTNSTIGGTASGAGNHVSDNAGDAITLDGQGDVSILGNAIGVDARGQAARNGGNGISLTILDPGTSPTTPLPLNDSIGGPTLAAGNTIANNGGAGIFVHNAYPAGITGLGIEGNSIFGNAKLGIDLPGSGVPLPSTLFLNPTAAPNGMVTVSGVYFGKPSTKVTIDIYANGADPSGYGQGAVPLLSASLTTNASGFAAFSPSFDNSTSHYTSYSATSTGPDGNTSEFSASGPVAPNLPQAELVVRASASASTIVVGNTITFTEQVLNYGPGTATDVSLADTLPTSLVNAQIKVSAGRASLDNNNVLVARLGTIAAGQFVTVTITATASQSGPILDQPGVSSTTFDPNYSDNFARQSVAVNPNGAGPNADLAISEAVATAPATAGGLYTYTVTVANNGPNTATNATVNDFLPAGASVVRYFSSQGTPPTLKGTLLTANLGTIAPGARATLLVTVTPHSAGTITNAANVSGNQFDTVPANNSTTLTSAVGAASTRINLQLTQSVYPSATGSVGVFQAFILTATNYGLDASPDTTLIENLPANVTFVQAGSTQGARATLTNGVLVEDFGTLAPGASATLTLVVTPTAPGLLTNVAGIYTPDVPSAAPSYASSTVSIQTGPSVIGLGGFGRNSELVLRFDADLNASTAINPANYQLVSLGTNGKGPARSVGIASVTYNSVARSVMITPTQALDPTLYYQIVVIGSTPGGVADTQGRRLVAAQYGKPGANYSAVFFAGTLPQI